jgi:CRP/FNR family transcriptional regulator
MNNRTDDTALQIGLRAVNDGRLAEVIAALDPSVRADFLRICEIRIVRVGDVLIMDAEMPEHLGFVLEGVLGIRKILSDGRTHILGILVPTDFYGRVFHNVSTYRVEALTAAKVLCLVRLPLEKLVLEHLALERYFLVNASSQIDAMRDWVLLLGTRKIVDRVASLLLILRLRAIRNAVGPPGASGGNRINIPIRRISLAEYLGTTVESLSRALRKLERDGLILIIDPYNFEIVDISALLRLAGGSIADPSSGSLHGISDGV